MRRCEKSQLKLKTKACEDEARACQWLQLIAQQVSVTVTRRGPQEYFQRLFHNTVDESIYMNMQGINPEAGNDNNFSPAVVKVRYTSLIQGGSQTTPAAKMEIPT